MPDPLSHDDHNAPKSEYTLVYPVLSRRAGGLSIGINLNPGKECNWACVYCEVEGLVRGTPEPVDVDRLEFELEAVVTAALQGRWKQDDAESTAAIRDLCIAGDGEPTLSANFDAAIEVAARIRTAHGLEDSTKLVVITNGSRVHRPEVLVALDRLAAAGGEIWFKVDAGSSEARAALNGISIPTSRVVESLALACGRVPTWIQTMVVHPHADPAGVARVIRAAQDAGAAPRGLLLYGLRRPSHQPGGEHLRALSHVELEAAAAQLRTETGLEVRVFE